VLERTPKQQLDDIDLLIARMFHLVVSAVHTSSQTFLDLLYDLALRPDVMEELQQEIYMELTREGGWSMSAFNRMTKLDSFIKESARFRPFVSC
jgi:cytochrome P450